jgi:hypothetical protein
VANLAWRAATHIRGGEPNRLYMVGDQWAAEFASKPGAKTYRTLRLTYDDLKAEAERTRGKMTEEGRS